ncbi:hypothetical protein ACIGN6_32215 [Streptomyces sp. NPDC053792]|uniref:hypothetical protein n=1 Tax=Streptomyces sp. NPDC053792 TaxID=3365716 RepID=UPI0037D2563A
MNILRKFAAPLSLSEDRKWVDAGLMAAADMISDDARTSLRDGRLRDGVADAVEGVRLAQKALYDMIALALANGASIEDLAGESHLSPEYLRQAFDGFNRDMWAQAGPDKNGREPWRVLG